ncbi:hypothetical protein OE88DRAFT_1063713 [Heliocybe sulcata]|uniref:Uncharacterized protein n=1 Tax=Heliocybe sulcata TaxID=5364 RepID=A0A5C3MM74_9AGAM|nr:hypothetical protein OE88DRAFT_1063713 [Heliocybe sulcata]
MPGELRGRRGHLYKFWGGWRRLACRSMPAYLAGGWCSGLLVKIEKFRARTILNVGEDHQQAADAGEHFWSSSARNE